MAKSDALTVETAEVPAGAAPGAPLTLSWAVEDTLLYPAEPEALAA